MKDGLNFEEIRPYCTGIRRHLHQYPELSFAETRTAQFIIAELKKLGLDGQPVAGTGVCAVLNSGLPGPTIAVRADIDALPLQEEAQLPNASKIPGIMHACGHDGHTAILLGLGKALTDSRPKVNGKVLFIFQPAEECPPGGALQVIASGVLDKVDYILGSHLTNRLAVGEIGLRPGSLMAAVDCFTVTVTGQGGHGASPHQCVDPIVIGAQLISAWQTIVSRRPDPLQPVVLTAGTFNAGTNFNIIPSSTVITGSVRCLDETLRKAIETEFIRITHAICQAHGGTARIDYKSGYPVLHCDPDLVHQIRQSIPGDGDGPVLTEMPPVMLSEDFAYFFIGGRNDGQGFIHENHHPRFDFDEEALLIGVKIYLAILEHILKI